MNKEVRRASQVALVVKNPPTNAGDTRDATPGGSGRSPAGGNGNPLQYSCLGNPTEKGAWRAVSMGLQSLTWPSTHTHKVRGDTLEYFVICGTYWERGNVHFNWDTSIFFLKLFIRNVLHWSKENAFSVWVRRHGQGFNIPFVPLFFFAR